MDIPFRVSALLISACTFPLWPRLAFGSRGGAAASPAFYCTTTIDRFMSAPRDSHPFSLEESIPAAGILTLPNRGNNIIAREPRTATSNIHRAINIWVPPFPIVYYTYVFALVNFLVELGV